MANSTLLASILLLLAIGLLIAAWRLLARVHIGEDFVLARRRLPAWLTGLGQAINSAPMWMLLSLVLFAYEKGLAAVWMAAATLIGLAFNWWVVAPRLRAQMAATQSNTLSQWFAAMAGDTLQAGMRRSVGAIVLVSLGLATVTLLQWAAHYLSNVLGIGVFAAVAILAVFLLLFMTGAGIWSTSFADAIQAGIVSIALISLAGYAWFAVLDGASLWPQLMQREIVNGEWFAGYSGLLAVALSVGVIFGAFGAIAQPPAIARYLACRDDATLQRARLIALAWSVVAIACALLIGWIARVALTDAGDSRALIAMLASGDAGKPSGSIVFAAFAVVFAAACASPLMAIAAHFASDWRRTRDELSLSWTRAALMAAIVLAGFAAMRMPMGAEERLWLSWHALSASLGPLLLVRLTGKRVRPGSSLGALWAGFVLTLLFYLMPDTPGDLLERCLPYIAGVGIALSGGERRQNPDRADRGDKTVHDHLPI